jgi:peptide deformylase
MSLLWLDTVIGQADASRCDCDASRRASLCEQGVSHGVSILAGRRPCEHDLTSGRLMESLSIVTYPHPALRWESKPIIEIDEQLRAAVRQMFGLMYTAGGVGLAANQVALPWRLFVINPSGDPTQTDQEFVFINPEILRRKGSVEGEEGCLSLPELYGSVRRSASIVVEAFDLEGQPFRMELEEYPARVVQHEYDHIEGVLFIDRMGESQRRDYEARLADFETQFRKSQQAGEIPSDEELKRRLQELEPRE